MLLALPLFGDDLLGNFLIHGAWKDSPVHKIGFHLVRSVFDDSLGVGFADTGKRKELLTRGGVEVEEFRLLDLRGRFAGWLIRLGLRW